jgi:hypothetical protein
MNNDDLVPEAGSLLEALLRLAAWRPRTPLRQSDLNCADVAPDTPALAGAGITRGAVGVV